MTGVRRILGVCLVLLASYFGLSLRAIVILSVLTLVVTFIVIPSIFHFSTYVQRQMIFLTWVKWPKLVDFDHPEREGLDGAINYYLESEPKMKIGVWQILPKSLVMDSQSKSKDWFLQSLSTGMPIVIYFHGNTGSRARDHRIYMYQVLQNLDYHVIAFDYRGYADSTQGTPTKRNVVIDGHKVYEHVKYYSNNVPVIIWGHSLGTGVSTQIVSDLCSHGDNPPTALILESPFNNIKDEIRHHPFSFLWRKMPWFDWLFTGSLGHSDVAFFSDQVIASIHIPILILHAKDDHVVPFLLGEKLYKAAKTSRTKESKPLFFIPFDEEHGFAHVSIHMSAELPSIVAIFVNKAMRNDWTGENFRGHLA